MAVPRSSDARLFYRCAFQRMEEAELLRQHKYHTAAVYLAGYGVECILKALILTSVPARARPGVLRTFHGRRGHELECLRQQYLSNGGTYPSREIARQFSVVNRWSTALRYLRRDVGSPNAGSFVKAADTIIRWADGRI